MSHSDGHHDHPPFLAHHFETPKQQFESGKLGMWLFLATEVLLFGGLFCGYAVWRGNHPDLFQYGSHFLDTKMGAINTCVLIASSMTMAMAVTVAQRNDPEKQDKRPLLVLLLVLTLMGAFGFMIIKYFEYTHKFHEGWYPGLKMYDVPQHSEGWNEEQGVAFLSKDINNQGTKIDNLDRVEGAAALDMPVAHMDEMETNKSTIAPPATADAGFNAAAVAEEDHADDDHADHGEQGHPMQDPDRPRNVQTFFNIYYMMTGLHGIHVVLGGIVICWLIVKSLRGQFSRDYFTPVDLGGLYWHVVDLIWIFLFPMFYLIH